MGSPSSAALAHGLLPSTNPNPAATPHPTSVSTRLPTPTYSAKYSPEYSPIRSLASSALPRTKRACKPPLALSAASAGAGAGRSSSARVVLVRASSSTELQAEAAAAKPALEASVAAGASACPFKRLTQVLPEKTLWDKVVEIALGISTFSTMGTVDPLTRQSEELQGQKFGRGRIFGIEGLMVGNAPLAKAVLGDEASFPTALRTLRQLGEENLLAVPPEKHLKIRSLLAPAFSPDEIEKYTPQVQELAVKHLDALAAAGEGLTDPALGPQSHPELELFTLEVICRLVAGLVVTEEELKELKSEFAIMIRGVFFPLQLNLPFLPFKAGVDARSKIQARIDSWVEASKKRLSSGREPRGVLDELVAYVGPDGERLTDAQLRDNMLLFLFAGFDTTAASICAALPFLALHPSVKEKLKEEQERMVAKHGQQLSSKALREMRYAERVVKETLRLRPVVAGLQRRFSFDAEYGGMAFRRGDAAHLALKYIMANDPTWADSTGDMAPAVFNPDRWAKASSPNQLPFGYGPHTCLGLNLAFMEAKTMLAVLVRGYEVVAVEEPEKWVYLPLLQPENGLPVILRKRSTPVAA